MSPWCYQVTIFPDSEPLRFQAAAFGIRHFVRWERNIRFETLARGPG